MPGSDVEADIQGAKPPYYAITVQPTFAGFYQHVLYRPSDGTLTNLSTCGSGVTADTTRLAAVHSSLLSAGFPSSIVIANTGNAAQAVTLGISDARDGMRLAAYTSPQIAANGQLIVSMDAIEAATNLHPSPGLQHYVVRVEGPFTGHLQHLVDNKAASVITDMTTACAVVGP